MGGYFFTGYIVRRDSIRPMRRKQRRPAAKQRNRKLYDGTGLCTPANKYLVKQRPVTLELSSRWG